MGPHGHAHGSGRGFGPRGRGRQAEPPAAAVEEVQGWLAGRLPDEWFVGPPELIIDRDEITIIGPLAAPTAAEGVDETAAAAGRIRRFREDTRDSRIAIARELETGYQRKVAWGASVGDVTEVFTSLAAPAMTRLRQPERQVLDTLVEGGVARSRAEALAWCVRLVGEHEQEWIAALREALDKVRQTRQAGPE